MSENDIYLALDFVRSGAWIILMIFCAYNYKKIKVDTTWGIMMLGLLAVYAIYNEGEKNHYIVVDRSFLWYPFHLTLVAIFFKFCLNDIRQSKKINKVLNLENENSNNNRTY